MMDGKKLTDLHVPLLAKLVAHEGFKKLSRTRIMQLMKEYKLL